MRLLTTGKGTSQAAADIAATSKRANEIAEGLATTFDDTLIQAKLDTLNGLMDTLRSARAAPSDDPETALARAREIRLCALALTRALALIDPPRKLQRKAEEEDESERSKKHPTPAPRPDPRHNTPSPYDPNLIYNSHTGGYEPRTPPAPKPPQQPMSLRGVPLPRPRHPEPAHPTALTHPAPKPTAPTPPASPPLPANSPIAHLGQYLDPPAGPATPSTPSPASRAATSTPK